MRMKMSEKTLERLFCLMPNVASLSVNGFVDLPPVVSESRFSERTLVKLDLIDCTFYNEDIIQMVKRISSTLRELRLERCEHLTEEAFTAIVSCTELRILCMMHANNFEDHHLRKILSNASHLECLKIGSCDLHIGIKAWSYSMNWRLFRDSSSLSWVEAAEVAWSEAFRCFGEVPNNGSVELEFVHCHDEVLCQMASSESHPAWQLSKSYGKTQQHGYNKRLRCFESVEFRALSVERYVPSYATHITELLRLGYENLTDDSLAGLALQYSYLGFLFLTRCNLTTDAGVESLLRRGLGCLRRLYLSSCSQL